MTGSEADTTTALSQADFACQVAKRAGGNRAHVYRPEEEAQLGFWP
ncbi:MAG: hypothetical protein GWN95_00030 [Gammaproteobacteria bacterium]|nr:hypothetical protein [Gammaproteobacteria bacterium]NIX06020.1 hypothetical protein [Gammaproteobacteria bacterium]